MTMLPLICSLLLSPQTSTSGGKTQADLVKVVQSALTHPELDLHYAPDMLSGPNRIDLVAPTLPAGTRIRLAGKELLTRKAVTDRKLKSYRYLLVEKVQVLPPKGGEPDAVVEGVLSSDNVYFTANLTHRFNRWIVYRFRVKIA